MYDNRNNNGGANWRGLPVLKWFVANDIKQNVGTENQTKAFIKFLVRQIVLFIFVIIMFFNGAFFKIIDIIMSFVK